MRKLKIDLIQRSKKNKMFKVLFLAVTLILSLNSCGGGSNNDQGVSVTFLSFNATEDGACTAGTGIDAIFIPTFTLPDGGTASIFTCGTVRNNMCTQGVRMDRAIIDYYIDGSQLQLPSTTASVATILARNGECSAGGVTSSLPSGFGSSPESLLSINAVPAQIMEYIALNRENLPEPPFNVNINVKLSGVTTSGSRIETNTLTLLGVVSSNNPFNPAAAGVGGATNGELTASENTTDINNAIDNTNLDASTSPEFISDDILTSGVDTTPSANN